MVIIIILIIRDFCKHQRNSFQFTLATTPEQSIQCLLENAIQDLSPLWVISPFCGNSRERKKTEENINNCPLLKRGTFRFRAANPRTLSSAINLPDFFSGTKGGPPGTSIKGWLTWGGLPPSPFFLVKRDPGPGGWIGTFLNYLYNERCPIKSLGRWYRFEGLDGDKAGCEMVVVGLIFLLCFVFPTNEVDKKLDLCRGSIGSQGFFLKDERRLGVFGLGDVYEGTDRYL